MGGKVGKREIVVVLVGPISIVVMMMMMMDWDVVEGLGRDIKCPRLD